MSIDLEQGFDFNRCIEGKLGDAHRRAGVAPALTEDLDHEIGGAVHHLRQVAERRHRVDEAAEPHAALDVVEVAERGLGLGQEIDRADAGGGLAALDGSLGAKLAS